LWRRSADVLLQDRYVRQGKANDTDIRKNSDVHAHQNMGFLGSKTSPQSSQGLIDISTAHLEEGEFSSYFVEYQSRIVLILGQHTDSTVGVRVFCSSECRGHE
jgi:hypothetical protein